jgi:hypothetical protein
LDLGTVIVKTFFSSDNGIIAFRTMGEIERKIYITEFWKGNYWEYCGVYYIERELFEYRLVIHDELERQNPVLETERLKMLKNSKENAQKVLQIFLTREYNRVTGSKQPPMSAK